MTEEIVNRYSHLVPELRTFVNKKLPFVPLYRPQKLITLRKFRIEVQKNVYKLPPEAEIYFEPKIDDLRKEFSASYYNSIVYGLTSIDPSSRRITLHKASFFHEWLMHLQPDRRFYPGTQATFRDIFDKYMIEDVSRVNGKKFFPFTLGINGLIFTADGYLIFQFRSSKTVIEKNVMSVSFGGTFNTIGVKGRNNPIAEKISEILEREYYIRVKPSILEDSTYLIGIDSNLIYMGKPDLYVFLILDADFDEFDVNMLEATHKQGVKIAPSFEDFIKEPIIAISKIRYVNEQLSHTSKSPFLSAMLSMLEDIFKTIKI